MGFSFVACEKTQDEPVATAKEQQELTPVAYASDRYRHESDYLFAPTGKKYAPVLRCKNLPAITIGNVGRYPVEIWFESSFTPEGIDKGGSVTISPKEVYSGHCRGNGDLKFYVRSTGDYASKVYYSFTTER